MVFDHAVERERERESHDCWALEHFDSGEKFKLSAQQTKNRIHYHIRSCLHNVYK